LWWENLRERNHLEVPGIDGKVILKLVFKTWNGGKDWIDLAPDRGRWRSVVNVAKNLRVS
jgi:hypothetical protein